MSSSRKEKQTGHEIMWAARIVVVAMSSALVAMAGASASTLAAPVSVGHSGWTWGDPTPQGENLQNVVFAGARGYAVGDFGTVLRSDDGGNTWIGLPSGTRSNLSLVQEVEPNIVVVGGGCAVRESTTAGASFQRLPVDESESKCASTVTSFSFLNASTGYIEQSDGTILLTTDGGQTLTPKTSVPLNGATAGEVAFVSPSIGFALTGGSGGGRIYRTTDGANSWTQVGSTPASLSAVTFVNAKTAYVVGANNTLMQSTDEGVTWHSLPLALPAGMPQLALTHISCSDEMHCLIATAPAAGENNANVLVRTTDGGKTGTLVSASELNLLSVAFSTAPNAVAVGQYGATVLSSDGGATFPNLISHNLRAGLHGPIRLGQTPFDAYAPWPAGQIAATTDSGESWNLLRVPTAANIEDVAFPSTQAGYVLSHAGTVFRTVNAGSSWSIVASGGPAPVAMLAPNPSTVLLLGPTGIRRSTDSGASFAPVNGRIAIGRRHGKERKESLSSFDLSHGGEIGGTAMFAFGNDVLESTNDGRSWTLVPRPLSQHPVTAIAFVSPTTGYVVSDGRMFFTGNRGHSWREILSVDTADVESMLQLSFSNASDGYVLGQLQGKDNVLMRTENGGATWTPEILGFPLGSVTAGGLVDYAEGGSITGLFQTTDGGLSPTSSTLTLAIAGSHKLSPAKLKRTGNRVNLSGRLSPALEGEIVIVSYFTNGAWHYKNATVNSSGTFALTVTGIRTTTDFIAQWTGNDLVSGAGTVVTQLTISHVKKKSGGRHTHHR
jgi:photosystem II stability/assembly factor-like uncharacterized protein